MANHEKGGYDVEFVDTPKDVTCCICLLVLREPMQAEDCGHRFCKSCVEDLKDENSTIICPQDRTANKVYKDKGKEREVLDYIVKCTNFNFGCEWTGELRDLKRHKEKCEFHLVNCNHEECAEQIQRRLLIKHIHEECLFRNIICDHCTTVVKFCNLEKHNRSCENIPMLCQRCERDVVPKHLMKDHLEKECPIVCCEYSDIGCQEMGCDHETDNLHHKIFKIAPKCIAGVGEILQHCSKWKPHHKLTMIFELVKRESMSLHKQTYAQEHLGFAIRKIREQEVSTDEKLREQESSIQSKCYNMIEEKFRQQDLLIQTKLREQRSLIESQKSELHQKSSIIQLQQNTIKNMQIQINEIYGKLSKIKPESLQSFGEFQNEVIWKIDNFHRKFQGVKRENTKLINTFFTQEGYHCMIELYLNGFGEGEGNYVSLYVGVKDGPFDNGLVWPMNARISYCVLKDNTEKLKQTYNTLADDAAKFFKHPKYGENDTCGTHEFISHNSINSFIVDDTLTLKVFIE